MAAGKIQGKWKEVEKTGDFDKFADVLGRPAQTPPGSQPAPQHFCPVYGLEEVFHQGQPSKCLREFQKEGDKWKSSMWIEGGLPPIVTYFRLGEPFTSRMADGQPLSILIKENEKGFVETKEITEGPLKGTVMTALRYVDDQDRMIVDSACKGATLKFVYSRI